MNDEIPAGYLILISHLRGIGAILYLLIDGLILIIDKGRLFRKIAFIGMMALTALVAQECYYIIHSEWTATDKAMLIAALTVPVGTLQGAIIKFYSQATGGE